MDLELLLELERALEGQSAGFRATFRLPPERAYGVYDPSLLVEVERSRFPVGAKLEPGAKFNTQGPDGSPIVVRVLEADDETVSLDGNHPLAGLELIFEVNVLEVSDSDFDDAAGGPDGRLH